MLEKCAHNPGSQKPGQQPHTSYAAKAAKNIPSVKTQHVEQRAAEKMATAANGITVSTPPSFHLGYQTLLTLSIKNPLCRTYSLL